MDPTGAAPLPEPRGPVSAALLAALTGPPGPLTVLPPRVTGAAALADEDLQLALFLCYELHYRGLAGVDEAWEWEPALLAVRAGLERRFLDGLRALPRPSVVDVDAVPAALADLVAADTGPSLAGYVQRTATLEQVREFLAFRSVYHLKEADPHSFGIPRLAGRAKAALVEIQADEYGGGRPGRMHAELFAATMRALEVDDGYGVHLDAVPAVGLAPSNAMSLFGLHRRWRGALLGHLAAFEMTSTLPNRRYGNGLRRLGYGPAATTFFDEHVEADAVHEQVAAHDLCGSFARAEPDRAGDVLFGAAVCLELDDRAGRHLLDRWAAGRSALRPVPDAERVPA